MADKNLTYIDVIRHGEPEGGRRYRGNGVDDPLTETGWQQMWQSVENRSWQHIISSPLTRCHAFAQKLSDKLNISCSIDERFKEIGFGTWEGLTPDDIVANDTEALDRFYADPVHNRPEGAEPLESFSHRVWQGYKDVLATHTHQRILIIAHAGVARAVTANILDLKLDDVYSKLRIEYGSIICSTIEDNKPPKIVI